MDEKEQIKRINDLRNKREQLKRKYDKISKELKNECKKWDQAKRLQHIQKNVQPFHYTMVCPDRNRICMWDDQWKEDLDLSIETPHTKDIDFFIHLQNGYSVWTSKSDIYFCHEQPNSPVTHLGKHPSDIVQKLFELSDGRLVSISNSEIRIWMSFETRTYVSVLSRTLVDSAWVLDQQIIQLPNRLLVYFENNSFRGTEKSSIFVYDIQTNKQIRWINNATAMVQLLSGQFVYLRNDDSLCLSDGYNDQPLNITVPRGIPHYSFHLERLMDGRISCRIGYGRVIIVDVSKLTIFELNAHFVPIIQLSNYIVICSCSGSGLYVFDMETNTSTTLKLTKNQVAPFGKCVRISDFEFLCESQLGEIRYWDIWTQTSKVVAHGHHLMKIYTKEDRDMFRQNMNEFLCDYLIRDIHKIVCEYMYDMPEKTVSGLL